MDRGVEVPSSTTYSGAAAVSTAKPPRKVAILGFGRCVKDCPWQDPSWELWAMNGFWRAAEPDYGIKVPEERYALWFDLHTLEYTRAYGKAAGVGDKQERWLEQQHPFPVFMLDHYDVFPSSVRYPVEDVVRRSGRDYFTSSVAYALAYAFSLASRGEIGEVGLWGVDLIHDTEYADQRPCAEFWTGRLEGLGVKITIHADSALLRQRQRYGYEAENPLLVELRDALIEHAKGLEQVIEKHRRDIETLNGQLHTDHGALQAVQGVIERLGAWNRGGKI